MEPMNRPGNLSRHGGARTESARQTGGRTPLLRGLFAMLKVLTPRLLEVLKVVHRSDPVSVRALAGRMKRYNKNIHRDLQGLDKFE
jgi:predicted transcriptional regulator